MGHHGPLLSCDQSADNGICFCLPSWKTPMALLLPLGWRCMETLPCHVSRPFAHQGCDRFGGSGITTSHVSATRERDAEHGEVVGLIGSKGPPLLCLSLQGFTRAALLLAASSYCPQPTSEEVTESCLTLSLQVESCKEAEGRQDAGGLRGSLQAVMSQLDLCATGRVREGIAAHSCPTSSQQGSGQQVSMTSALPPHPKIQGRAPRAQGSPSGVLQAMTGEISHPK